MPFKSFKQSVLKSTTKSESSEDVECRNMHHVNH